MALTESWLKSKLGKASQKELVKADRDGLSARVSPKGKITFAMRYYYAGDRKRLDLGSYPLMSLKEARDETVSLPFYWVIKWVVKFFAATGKRPYLLVDLYGGQHALPRLIDDKQVRSKDVVAFFGEGISHRGFAKRG